MAAAKLLLLLLQLLFLCVKLTTSNLYSEYYAKGLNSYFDDNDWETAAETFQKSIQDYKLVNNARLVCSNKCDQEPVNVPSDYVQNDQLHFFYAIIQKASCRQKCTKELIGDRSNTESVSSKIEKAINSGELHNYIQYSLYQTGQVTKAASYAATHLHLSPDDSSARANMEFYKGLEELSKDNLQPIDSKTYRNLYTEGQEYYNQNEYEKMVEKFEESLKNFYEEVEKCRSECEGPQVLTETDDFPSAMWSVHYNYLKCRSSCPEKLGKFRDENHNVDFVGSFFHYLTYGYFHLGKMTESARAVTTHLRIEPNSPIATMNRGYLKQQPGITIKDFVEREDAKKLLDRMDEDRKLLESIKDLLKETSESKDDNSSLKTIREEDKDDDIELLQDDYIKFPIIVEKESEETKEEQEIDSNKEKFQVIETAKDHGGVERVLIDNILNQEQCQQLLELTKHCQEGDGYQKKSPHTPHEKFEGLTVMDAAKGAVRKHIDKEQVQLYMNASKIVRRLLVQQFNLTKTLYFSYTHLVCRTANPNAPESRSDLSHPVHADNCFQEVHNGECLKRPPAYTWRDYSAILYLNGDFKGGNFFFAHSPFNSTPQHYVEPKCGRMVGFSAGKENMHGVTAITSGKRCAIALWLTLDPEYKETAFDEAQTLLNGIA